MAWHNSDGLYVKFGTEEATVAVAGSYAATRQFERMTEVVITLANLADATETILNDTVTIPKGARITRVRVINQTAATGTNATLDLGLIDQDRSTELDYDGLLTNAPLTDFDTVGEIKEYTIGVTGIGALCGTTLSNTGLITASYDTAAFTAGVIRVQIYYFHLS